MSNYNYKIKQLTIKSGDRSVDLSNGFVSLDYYEDVTSPTIVIDVNIIDGDGAIADLPLLGGEYFDLEIEAVYDKLEEILFSTENGNPLCVVNASYISQNNARLYTIRLMSADVLANETTRVVQRYDAPISQIVTTILKDEKNLINTKKNCIIDTTANSYSFIGCFRRPFDIIAWLCPKSVSDVTSNKNADSSQSAGFLFYETRKGYNFRSIDSQFQKSTNPVELFQSSVPLSLNDPKYYKSFSNIQIKENNDVLKSLRMGTYSHYSIFLNMNDMKYDVVNTKLSTKYKEGLKPSNPDSTTFKLNGLEEYPSRLMYKLLDPGVMERTDKDGNSKPVPVEQLAKNQADAYMRYNLLFTSVTSITLPLNITLCAGDVVKCKISKSKRGNVDDKYDENTEEQRYIISRIRHTFDKTNNFSSLELISDSYSVTST
ncbi:tail protein [Synechococcus phage DSL-LC02]|nr:tail protein [Synechococcus phage DSL-LC02]